MDGICRGPVDHLMPHEENRIKRQRQQWPIPERRLCDYHLVKPPRPHGISPVLFRGMVARLRWRRYGEPLH
jgi:hypothetical protein